MTTSSDSTESKTGLPLPNTTGYDAQEIKEKAPSDEESKTDDLGYDKEEPKVEESKEEPKKESKEEPEELETLPGYDKEEPKEEDPKEEELESEDKPEDKPEELEALKKEDIDKLLTELPEGVNKERISALAENNKLSEEQISAFVEYSKQEESDFNSERERLIKEQKSAWKNELETDSEFGGDNYDRNVHHAAQVLNNYMENTKKILTDKGGMLPPSIMKDLAKLYRVINPTTSFEAGDANEENNGVNEIDQMYE